MPRVPVSIQSQPIGSANPNIKTGRSVPLPSIRQKGPSQQRERFADRQLNRIQDAANEAVSVVKGLPFADGNLIQGVPFVAGQTATLNHGLGRTWVGFFVVNRLLVPAAPRGTATLLGGVVTVTPTHGLVPNAGPLAISVSYNTISGTPGSLSVPNADRTATTFKIHSSAGLSDGSTVDWLVSPPWPGDFAGVPNPQTDAATINITAPYTCVSDVWVY